MLKVISDSLIYIYPQTREQGKAILKDVANRRQHPDQNTVSFKYIYFS